MCSAQGCVGIVMGIVNNSGVCSAQGCVVQQQEMACVGMCSVKLKTS